MAECGWTWERCLETESLVSAALWQHLPTVHLRRAYPLAQLAAMLGNVNGGKAEGGKRMDPRKAFTALEFLPPWARPPGFEAPAPMLSPGHCAALVEALDAGQLENCSWVLQVIGLEDPIENVLESGRRALETRSERAELAG